MSFSAMVKRGRFRETTNSLSPGGSFRCFCFKFLALDDNKYQQVLQTIVLATASDFRPGHKSLRTGNSILTDTGWSGWFFGPETAGNWSSPSGLRRCSPRNWDPPKVNSSHSIWVSLYKWATRWRVIWWCYANFQTHHQIILILIICCWFVTAIPHDPTESYSHVISRLILYPKKLLGLKPSFSDTPNITLLLIHLSTSL